MLQRLCLGGVMLMCAAGWAQAAVVFDNGDPDFPNGGNLSDDRSSRAHIENVTLTQGANVDGIRFWAMHQNDTENGVDQGLTLEFLSLDGDGRPTVLDASRTLTVSKTAVGTYGFYDIYRYDATFAPVTLDAGVTYGVTVFHVASAEPGQWRWFASDAGDSSNWVRLSSGVFASGGTDSAFELLGGPVPEPASLGLLALGGTALLRRRH